MVYFCQLVEAQTVYSERYPYVIEDRLGGEQNHVVIFNSEYITLLRKAFTTDCVNDMSEDELKMTNYFTSYENGLYESEATVALDAWIMNLYTCDIENPTVEGCAEATVEFTECDGTTITA